MELRSPLSRARGLGSSHHGLDHWWRQRVTALILLPTGIWFVLALSRLPDLSYETTRAWVAQPFNAILLLTFLGTSLYHAALGLRVILEDYVSNRRLRLISVMLINGLFGFAAIASLYALLSLSTLV